jgi:hypothetical protein
VRRPSIRIVENRFIVNSFFLTLCAVYVDSRRREFSPSTPKIVYPAIPQWNPLHSMLLVCREDRTTAKRNVENPTHFGCSRKLKKLRTDFLSLCRGVRSSGSFMFAHVFIILCVLLGCRAKGRLTQLNFRLMTLKKCLNLLQLTE